MRCDASERLKQLVTVSNFVVGTGCEFLLFSIFAISGWFFLKHVIFLNQNLQRVFPSLFFNNLPAEAAFRILSFRLFVRSAVFWSWNLPFNWFDERRIFQIKYTVDRNWRCYLKDFRVQNFRKLSLSMNCAHLDFPLSSIMFKSYFFISRKIMVNVTAIFKVYWCRFENDLR